MCCFVNEGLLLKTGNLLAIHPLLRLRVARCHLPPRCRGGVFLETDDLHRPRFSFSAFVSVFNKIREFSLLLWVKPPKNTLCN